MGDTPHPPLLIVPDTNVCASGTVKPTSPSGRILQAWKEGTVHFALCDGILTELEEVLQRPYFVQQLRWDTPAIAAFVDDLRKASQIFPAVHPAPISPDPDDNMLFSCAVEAKAHYIVSGNERHVLFIPEYMGIRTISPRGFVEQVLKKELKSAA